MTEVNAIECRDCGAKILASALFCSQCGAEIARVEEGPELRELTVMFCDLVGSTHLSDTLDPEDLRDITVSYQEMVADVVKQENGHIAQYLGDGVLVYFGYPSAREDDARRAVRAALGIESKIKSLNATLKQRSDVELAVRIGLHTGRVIVGEIGSGPRRENIAMGRTPNIAARIQALAGHNTTLISNDTYRLVDGYFVCEPAGEHRLKGISSTITVHRVIEESDARSRIDASRLTGLTAFTGRSREIESLDRTWRSLEEGGRGHTVMLNGEPGIGKSRIVVQLIESIVEKPNRVIECSCSVDSRNRSLQPIIGALEIALQFKRGASDAYKWAALKRLLGSVQMQTDDVQYLIAVLLGIELPADFDPPEYSPQKRYQKTLGAIKDLLISICAISPVLFVIEDVQWADPTTLELLASLAVVAPDAQLMMLVTFRSDFSAPLQACNDISALSLERLDENSAYAIINHLRASRVLPEDILEQLIARGEGVPLYLEEITKSFLDSGVLVEPGLEDDLAGSPSTDLIPPSLRSSLLARLDRLGPAKAVAQLASTIGREFRLDVLEAVAQSPGKNLTGALEALIGAELIYPLPHSPDPAFLFRHALIQDAAYQSMLKRTRREQHGRIARTYAEKFPEIAEQRPELLAHHFAAGERTHEATRYWFSAGRQSLANGANYEAIAYLTSALEQLEALPPSAQRSEFELDCFLALTPALQMAKGWAAPEVEEAFKREAELFKELPESPHALKFLSSSTAFHVMRGNVGTALEQSTRLHRISAEMSSPGLNIVAHGLCAVAHLYSGEIVKATEFGEAGLALLNPEFNRSIARKSGLAPEVNICCYLNQAWWELGFPDVAREYAERAIRVARETEHKPSEEFAVGHQTQSFHMDRNPEGVLEAAENARAIAGKRRSPFWGPVTETYSGWAMCVLGSSAEGIELMRRGVKEFVISGHGLSQVCMRVALAEGLGMSGAYDEALSVIDETVRISEETGEVLHIAEAYRLRGDCLRNIAATLSGSAREECLLEAESALLEALRCARAQTARSLELRAAISHFQLRTDCGDMTGRSEALAATVSSFPDDLRSPEMIDARALLAGASSH